MQEDLDRILRQVEDTIPDPPETEREEHSLTVEREATTPAFAQSARGSEMRNTPDKENQGPSFADQIKMVQEKTMEREREFQHELKEVQEQDPALAKKIAVVIVAIIGLVMVFAAVVFYQKNKKEDTPTPPVNVAIQQPVESEEDKLKAAQDVNDKLRVESITTIAQVAAVYHLEQKADLPVSPTHIKLNEANPVSEFLQDALTRYGHLAGVLLDPKDPDYYYAYRSVDGKTIEVSARLENESGQYCKEGASPCIYKKVISEEDMEVMSVDLEKYK